MVQANATAPTAPLSLTATPGNAKVTLAWAKPSSDGGATIDQYQVQRFNDRGLDVVASSPEELGAHLKSEVAKWGRVIKERGMRAE